MADEKEAPAAAEEAKASEGSADAASGQQEEAKKSPPPKAWIDKSKYGKRTIRAKARKRRKKMLQDDPEFAKTYFGGKSKRSADKKLAFRKRHEAK